MISNQYSDLAYNLNYIFIIFSGISFVRRNMEFKKKNVKSP